ncbi:MAG: inositol monophosphatase family protein [Gemmatimonadota bacterium]|nr:inositol monophosphatase family protein [Gemmatimonadota bacterium]
MPERPEGRVADGPLLEAARAAATAAAEVHAEGRGRIDPSRWSEKGRADFVTEVDVEAERRIVAVLRDRFPDHAVLAEEASSDGGPEGVGPGGEGPGGTSPDAAASPTPVRWIVDPLDGTTNWLHGYPEYAVSLAAADAEGLRVGVVLNSATGERFEAVRDGGATLDGAPIRVSNQADLELALVGTGFPFKKIETLRAYLAVFERVLRATSGIRRGGSAALDLCDLAAGRLDAFFEYWLMPWDVAAGALIVREAGGVFEPLEVPGLPEAAADGGHGGLRPGGFLGANAALADTFRRLVSG